MSLTPRLCQIPEGLTLLQRTTPAIMKLVLLGLKERRNRKGRFEDDLDCTDYSGEQFRSAEVLVHFLSGAPFSHLPSNGKEPPEEHHKADVYLTGG